MPVKPSSSTPSASEPVDNASADGSQPDSKHRSRRKWWRKKRYWAALAVFLLLYPVTATAALWSGFVENALRSEDLRVEIDKPAYSIIPGHVNAKGIRIFMNGLPQFTLFAENINARFQLLPLFKRRVSLSWLGADNVKFRMRLPLKPEDADDPRTKAFPELKGIPGINSVREDEAQAAEEDDSLWTVNLHNLGVEVTELWFFEYRYLGRGELKGGFERGPEVLRVNTSVQELGPGKLYFGENRVISHNFRGKIEAKIPEVNPKEHADLGFFDFVKANIELHGDIEHLEHTSAYVAPARITGGGGPLDAKLVMDGGKLSDKTLITFKTKELNYFADGLGVKSDISLRIDVRKHAGNSEVSTPHMKSESQVTYLSLTSPGGDPFTIQIHGHQEEASLASSTIDERIEVKHASVDCPKITSRDLDDVSALASVGAEGEAEAKLRLVMDKDKNFHGPFEAVLRDFEMEVAPVGAKANGSTKAQLSIFPEGEHLTLSDLTVKLSNVDFVVDKDRIDDWWFNFQSKKVDLGWGEPPTIFAKFGFVARDAEPFLQILTEGSKVPGIVADLIKLRNVRAHAEVHKRGERLDVMTEQLKSEVIDFSGRLYQDKGKLSLALLVGGKAVSLGIVQHGEERRFQAFAHADWLNAQLAQFPPPPESVMGQKP